MVSLIPWTWGKRSLPIRREETAEHPIVSLQREMNRLFDEFFRGFELTPFGQLEEGIGMGFPRMDVSETDKELLVTAEVPGLTENDIDISLSRDTLTISGEKKAEKEEQIKGYYRMERSYGSFRRSIAIPTEVDTDKAEASFKNGVLTIKLPKTPEAQRVVKSIPIKKE